MTPFSNAVCTLRPYKLRSNTGRVPMTQPLFDPNAPEDDDRYRNRMAALDALARLGVDYKDELYYPLDIRNYLRIPDDAECFADICRHIDYERTINNRPIGSRLPASSSGP